MNTKHLYLLAFAMIAPAFASASEIASTPNTSVLKITDKISRDGSQLSVEAIPTESFSNWHYEIRIAVEGKPSQVIPIRNGQALKNTDFQLVDLNGDGFLDIMIASGMDYRDKPWFKTLIYSQDTHQYQWIGLKAAADPEIKKAELQR